MMVYKMVALFDVKSGIFHTPFCVAHTSQAIRSVVELGRDMTTSVGRHPQDYSLVLLGDYDDQTGMVMQGSHLVLGTVVSFVKEYELARPNLFERIVAPASGNGVARREQQVQEG